MKIGRLRELVRFQRRTTLRNDFGEDKDTWSDITGDTPADVEPLSGREYFAVLQTQSDISIRVRCRYASALADLTPKDRIRHGDLLYDIRSVIDIENRHRELEILCTRHFE